MAIDDSSSSWDLMAEEITAAIGDPIDKAATLASVRKRLLARKTDHAPSLARHILLRRLGSGGSGIVYEAFDPELERKVAIKLLKITALHDSLQGIARLKREAQALARLSHPNVIAVYDVGAYGEDDLSGMLSLPAAGSSEAEIPPRGLFVVMELVEGPSLRTWMRGEHDIRTRLEVMLQAGRGLAAAHAEGLVHRDFKPDNVQVGANPRGLSTGSATGAAYRVRVLDFGLARAASTGSTCSPSPISSMDSSDDADERGGDLRSPLTRSGVVAGTPAYMSPEQHTGAEADARSDQYNFCVTLFEVLAGARPFPQRSAASLLRAKTQGVLAEPPRDGRVPERIWRAIRRGLSPDPDRRFASMEALLRELERRPGAWLRWAGAGAVLCAVPVTLWLGRTRPEDLCEAAADTVEQSWSRSTEERLRARIARELGARADEVWDKARRRLGTYADEWRVVRTEACLASLQQPGPSEATALDARVACLERRRRDLQLALDVLLSEDGAVVGETLSVIDGLQPLSACTGPNAAVDILPPPGPQRAEALEIMAELSRGQVLGSAGRHARQAEVTRAAVQRARTLAHGPTLARALVAWGSVQWDAEALDDALASLQEAAVLAERHGDEATALEALSRQAGLLGKSKLQYDTALRMLEWVEARSGDPHVRIRAARYRGMFYQRQARPEDAVVVLEEALELAEGTAGSETLVIESLLAPLANAYNDLGRTEDALAAYRRALAVRSRVLGEGPGDAMIHNNLGGVLLELGDTDEACRSYARAHDMFVEMYGPEHSSVAMVLNNLGMCQLIQGDAPGALVTHRRSLAVKERTVGPKHPDCGYSHVNIGDALLELGEAEAAAQAHQRGLEVWTASLGDTHPLLGVPLAGLADAALLRGELAEAEARIDAGLAIVPEDRMGDLRARLLFARARLRHESDPAAGIALAREARSQPGIDGEPLLRATLDRWLSEHAAGRVVP